MLRFARWWVADRFLTRTVHRLTKPRLTLSLSVTVRALRLTQCLTAAVWLSLTAGVALGESYPNKPITLVVTAAPGGVTDILARVLGQRLTKSWGQQVIVENKPGASNQSVRSTSQSRRPTATRCW